MHPIMHPHEICLSHASPDYLPVRHSVPSDAPLVSSELRASLAWGAATVAWDILKFCSHVVRSWGDCRGLEADFYAYGFFLGRQVNTTERYDCSRVGNSAGVQPDPEDRSARVRFNRHSD